MSRSRRARFARVGTAVVIATAVTVGVIDTLDHRWTNEALIDLAVTEELTRDLLDPRHPFLAAESPSARYGPIAVGWAALASIAGLSALTILEVAAIVHLLVLLGASIALSHLRYSSRWAPPLGLAAALAAWGPPISTRGGGGLASHGHWLGSTEMGAAALAIVVLVVAERWAQGPNRALGVLGISLTPIVVLSDLLVGSVLALGLLLLSADHTMKRGGGPWIAMAAASAFAVLTLSAAWPWFDLFELIALTRSEADLRLGSSSQTLLHAAPAMAAVAGTAAASGHPRSWGWPIKLGLAGSATWGVLAVSGGGGAIVATLSLWIALAEVGGRVAAWIDARHERRRDVVCGLTALGCMSVAVAAWTLSTASRSSDGSGVEPVGAPSTPELDAPLAVGALSRVGHISLALEPSAIVATENTSLARLVAASGARPVQPVGPVSVKVERLAFRRTNQYLIDPALSESVRRREARRFGVTHLVVTDSHPLASSGSPAGDGIVAIRIGAAQTP